MTTIKVLRAAALGALAANMTLLASTPVDAGPPDWCTSVTAPDNQLTPCYRSYTLGQSWARQAFLHETTSVGKRPRDVIGTAQQAADFCRAGLLQVPSELRPDQRAFLMGCAEVLGGLAESHGIKW
ncbi:hypothetical protein MXEN_16727 [Mycobacterium xenopi RIVM700367]|uniref:hypothetical protein n=1 Tax=Mycobacterium xenopi TaxID=1789 RepID=UPI00025AE67E|nr:hypothetical protein [Mycobacterium xenopi]EID11300.1 hypothetical protein MXEN_16727 [Mycobacterium xenopi RIVM700367]